MEACGQLRNPATSPLSSYRRLGVPSNTVRLLGFESWSSSQQPIHIAAHKSVTDFVPVQDEGKAAHMFASGLDGSKQPFLQLGAIE